MKITFIQIEQAYRRAVFGESVRSLARELGVDESTLRQHFRKGLPPRALRDLALQKMHAEQARSRLDAAGRQQVDLLVKQARRVSNPL